MSYRQALRRDFSAMIAGILEEAVNNGSDVDQIIKEKVKYFEGRIKELKGMNDPEFMRHISQSIFGVASKDFYLSNYRKAIENLKRAANEIKSLRELRRENQRIFNYRIRETHQGYVKEIKSLLQSLDQTKLF